MTYDHLDITLIGPVGSGKSSLVGSLCRAVNEEDHFPDRVQLTLNHPDEDTHGTMQWMETNGNKKGTIVYQDTRGDQVSLYMSDCVYKEILANVGEIYTCTGI